MSLLGKKLLSAANRSKRSITRQSTAFKSFDDAHHIGILYTWEDAAKEKLINEFAEVLGSEKSLDFLCYNPDKKKEIDTTHSILTMADLSMFGKINSETALVFEKQPFDYLFHLDFKLNELTRSVLLNSQAECKIGCHSNEGEGLFDLMIKINESAGLKNLSEQMLIYVKALKQ